MLKDDTELELYRTGENNQFYKTTICHEVVQAVVQESLQLLIILRQADECDTVAGYSCMFPTLQ